MVGRSLELASTRDVLYSSIEYALSRSNAVCTKRPRSIFDSQSLSNDKCAIVAKQKRALRPKLRYNDAEGALSSGMISR
jgi:hypothetical protein